MVDLKFTMRAELDVEFRSDVEYSTCMRDWFEDALREVFHEQLGIILDGPPLAPRSCVVARSVTPIHGGGP
jgi:hypothetical protein